MQRNRNKVRQASQSIGSLTFTFCYKYTENCKSLTFTTDPVCLYEIISGPWVKSGWQGTQSGGTTEVNRLLQTWRVDGEGAKAGCGGQERMRKIGETVRGGKNWFIW